jgi:hypothetical protein
MEKPVQDRMAEVSLLLTEEISEQKASFLNAITNFCPVPNFPGYISYIQMLPLKV